MPQEVIWVIGSIHDPNWLSSDQARTSDDKSLIHVSIDSQQASKTKIDVAFCTIKIDIISDFSQSTII
jgi:hypothetical protein